jgi:uncharacterized protein YcfJ
MQATVPVLIASALLSTHVASHAVEYATVVSATPVVVSVPVARRQCADEQQLVQPRQSGAGAVLGAIVGGVIGHNVGAGMGRAAATGVGVMAGAVIGDQVEANAAQPYATTVRNCRNVSTLEPRTVGYDVQYDYAGQRYSTRLPRDPGPRMAIDVRPAVGVGGEGAAPVYDTPAQPGAAAPEYYRPVPAAGRAVAPVVYYDDAAYAQPYYGTYIVPSISLGFGYYGGYRGGRHGR